ncbi:MAG: myo-inosose-2 dehydratase [Gammaproteobacteria bacterium]
MTIRIGINPIAWTNDDLPELGDATPLDTCLAEGKQAGYDGFELGRKFPRDAKALKPILERHGLALVGGWYSLRLLERDADAEIAALQAHLQLLKALDCSVFIVAEVSRCIHGDRTIALSRRPRLGDREWEGFGKRMTAVGDYIQGQGMSLAYHHHMGTVVETEAETDRLMASTGPAVGLLLDTGHMTFAGGDPLAVARRHGPRIQHVHCKDIRPQVLAQARAKDWSFLDAVVQGVFTVPGDGCVDYPAVLGEVKRQGYRGEWLVVEAEQDPAVANPLHYATMGQRYLRKLAAELGF